MAKHNPEERYVTLETKQLPDGRVVYKSALPITVVGDPNTDVTFVASDLDRLDILANNAYGSSMSWWRIAAANNRVNGSVHIKPGTHIIIPQGN